MEIKTVNDDKNGNQTRKKKKQPNQILTTFIHIYYMVQYSLWYRKRMENKTHNIMKTHHICGGREREINTNTVLKRTMTTTTRKIHIWNDSDCGCRH